MGSLYVFDIVTCSIPLFASCSGAIVLHAVKHKVAVYLTVTLWLRVALLAFIVRFGLQPVPLCICMVTEMSFFVAATATDADGIESGILLGLFIYNLLLARLLANLSDYSHFYHAPDWSVDRCLPRCAPHRPRAEDSMEDSIEQAGSIVVSLPSKASAVAPQAVPEEQQEVMWPPNTTLPPISPAESR